MGKNDQRRFASYFQGTQENSAGKISAERFTGRVILLISVFIGVLANILRAYSIYRFMELLYMPKDKADKRLPYLAFVLLTSGGYYLFHQQMINIVTNLAGLFWIASAYYGSLRKNILLVFSIYSVNAVVECLVFFVSDFRRYTQIRESVNECITSILILSIVILLERTKAVKNKKFHLSLPLFAGAVSIPVGSVFTVMLLLQGVLEENWFLEVIIMDILAVNIIFFYLYGAIQDYYQQKTEKEIFLTKMKIYSRQLDIQKNSMDRIREIRHDMKHHIEELKYLARRKDTEKLMAYLTEMQRHMVNEEELVSSGNYNIDGTLNYFLHMAKEKLNRVEIQVPESTDEVKAGDAAYPY